LLNTSGNGGGVLLEEEKKISLIKEVNNMMEKKNNSFSRQIQDFHKEEVTSMTEKILIDFP